MGKTLVYALYDKRNMHSYQLQPGGTRITCEIFYNVLLVHRFEDAGVRELVTGEDAEERYDVRVREIATNEGMAVESLHSSSERNSGS